MRRGALAPQGLIIYGSRSCQEGLADVSLSIVWLMSHRRIRFPSRSSELRHQQRSIGGADVNSNQSQPLAGVPLGAMESREPMIRVNGFIVLLLLLTFTRSAFTAEAEVFTPDESIVYKTVGETELKLHVFNPKRQKSSTQRPAIVFFFGGGWNSGSASQFYPHCDFLASRGMVAMSAEYRVKSRDGVSPRECVQDGKSAIRWVRQHAAELGVDASRIAAGGGSAGGHVAAATGTTKGFEDEDEDLSISSMPNALVLFNPVYDNGPAGYGHSRVRDYWQEFSPLHNIHKNTPPTIVFLGTKDKLIPVTTAEQYQQRMVDQGLRCDLHLYAGKGHGFFNFKHAEEYQATVAEMGLFLESLGYLERTRTSHGD